MTRRTALTFYKEDDRRLALAEWEAVRSRDSRAASWLLARLGRVAEEGPGEADQDRIGWPERLRLCHYGNFDVFYLVEEGPEGTAAVVALTFGDVECGRDTLFSVAWQRLQNWLERKGRTHG